MSKCSLPVMSATCCISEVSLSDPGLIARILNLAALASEMSASFAAEELVGSLGTPSVISTIKRTVRGQACATNSSRPIFMPAEMFLSDL